MLYERGDLTEDEFVSELTQLGLDAKTLDILLATENKYRRKKRDERKRPDNDLYRKHM